MATQIEAIIFDGDRETAALPQGVRTVQLEAGLTMVPVTQDLRRLLDVGEGSDERIAVGDERIVAGDERIPGNWVLKQSVAALARAISHDRNVVYFFSETTGGPGITEAIAWHEGRLLYGPSGTCDIELDLEPGYHLAPHDNALNAALRAIGVRATGSLDEYDTVGLYKHRMTDEWLED